MATVPRIEIWNELDKATWYPLMSLGPLWLGKWTSSTKGYSVMVTDGVDIWGEQRNTSYIEEKAQEWAACLESGVAELTQLFLSQLKECNVNIRVSLEENSDRLTLELTAYLDVLPYSWLFYLTKLHGKVIERHWTLPLTVTLQLLSVQISKLEDELSKKTRQLEEYLPVQTKKDPNSVLTSSIDTAVETVLEDGIGLTLSRQLSHSSVLLSRLEEKRKLLLMSSSLEPQPHNRPKLKKTLKGAFCGEDTMEKFKAEEATQRSHIQALTQAPILPIKKKKKLNI